MIRGRVMPTRTCRACRTRLDPAVPDDRHPLCRLDPPPTVDEVRTAIALLDAVLGITPVADEGSGIADRSHVNDLDHHDADRDHHRADARDHHDPATRVCLECSGPVPAGVVRHPPCYRRHVDDLRRDVSHRTGYRIRPSDFRADQLEE